jgi:hypothetical protein
VRVEVVPVEVQRIRSERLTRRFKPQWYSYALTEDHYMFIILRSTCEVFETGHHDGSELRSATGST